MSACPSTNKPPSTPTGLSVTSASPTGVTLGWSPSTDDVAVAGYGVYLSGSKATETTATTAGLTDLKCGTTYAVGVDAFDGAGKRSSVAQLSTATSTSGGRSPAASDASLYTSMAIPVSDRLVSKSRMSGREPPRTVTVIGYPLHWLPRYAVPGSAASARRKSSLGGKPAR